MSATSALLTTLAACRKVLITTHARPDGDALGSTAAMAMGLQQKGIAADVLLLTHLPTKYAFVYQENNIAYRDVEAGFPPDFSLDPYDALLVIDTGTWSQLPGLRPYVDGWPKPKLVIDHHLTQESWADQKLVVKEAAAAGEIVAGLLREWGVTFTPGLASALFLAICTDTGWFQFSNTRPETFRLAATLKEAGVDTDRLQQLIYQNERLERLALQSKAMQSLALFYDNQFAVMTVRKQDFLDTHANVPDTEGVVNWPLQIRTVQVAVLLTEPLDTGPVRVSLRSKGKVDVAKFAEQFQGGGHARAAGLKFDIPIDAAREKLITAMRAALPAT